MDSAFTIASRQSEALQRAGATAMIFVISLFAVSFPYVSSNTTHISLPHILFFVGKHFGTGVILSTAFVHLLQDAFKSLNNRSVREISNIGDWTGLIVLASLLTIFFIEYISSSYVSRLDPEHKHHHGHAHDLEASLPSHSTHSHESCKHSSYAVPHERTPLVAPQTKTSQRPQTLSAHSTAQIFEGHHHFESRASHCTDGPVSPRALPKLFCNAHDEHPCGTEACSHRTEAEPNPYDSTEDDSTTVAGCSQDTSEQPELESPGSPASSPRRQIVGILVLQIGIMIHSFVIGLTLSITSGPEFSEYSQMQSFYSGSDHRAHIASLLTAITFHQLFEGLSLGTRIATLPTNSRTLRPLMMMSFAATVPIGIAAGFLLFTGSYEGARMRITQGVMAAISAGMLIYAASVEMLAGDFIMDPSLWKSDVGKQALALSSLLVGASAMALIGLWG
ncbi:Zinc/iron permease [Thelephora terrestris]|uniref:Zinc/iron permease n=1 Tax=Thelephora terrestris TaxID=56493 RepID=A0A9P6L8V7_9AGAM|nr:Zinc/iron permease [Thelephora terrestris]